MHAIHYTKYINYFFVLLVLASCRPQMSDQEAVFVGRQTCVECHQKEYDLWVGSDHDFSMDTAIEETVLGDFDDAEFVHNGFTHKFYKKEGKFYVHTLGTGGGPADLQIAYTFGFRPLQQYLIPFEDGRFQCLQISWDTENQRWYHLADSVYKDQEIPPDDWLYWTNNAQNWNGMCAECHSTNLKKNYDPETREFHTTWSEIDVSCEACHGPSSRHNEWAAYKEGNRPEVENYALEVKTSEISSRELIDQCGYCHARRSSYEDFIHPRERFFDIVSPQLPIEPMYYADGQILEEDYVYASFLQSKMHMNKVRCTNCHDVHSLKLQKQGNDLCLQCHKKADYDNYKHHFHKYYHEEGEALQVDVREELTEVGAGSLCINCHMAGTYFMGVDFRRDHSMRVPRPDLSDALGTPNACIQCHADQSNAWAASYTEKWYDKPKAFHFGETMHQAYRGDTNAVEGLLEIINNPLNAPMVKAAATQYLTQFNSESNNQVIKEMLNDPEAIVRREAIKGFIPSDPQDLVNTIAPFLNDTVKMVRIEAVIRISELPDGHLSQEQKRAFDIVVDEYIKALNYSADFAASRFNLGNLYGNIGQHDLAIKNYKEALRIDAKFYPAIVNLAMLYNRMGKNEQARELLLYMIEHFPDENEPYYSLGLLMAEMEDYDASLKYLEMAAVRLPERSRILFNLYQLYLFKGMDDKAEEMLTRMLKLEPSNMDYLMTALEHCIKLNDLPQARSLARKILDFYPEHQNRKELENFIEGS